MIRYVHRLVAFAFLFPPRGPEVNHKDGDPSNNHVLNLEWVTHRQNELHARRVLKRRVGENHYKAKVTEAQVREIRELIKSGKSKTEIANVFGITASAVYSICKRKSWRCVV